MTADVTEQIAALGTRMDRGFAAIDKRFEEMDRRFDGVEGRLGEVEGRLGEVEGRLGEVEGRLGVVEGRVGGIEERVGGIELKLDLYKEEYFAPVLQALGEGFTSLNERLDRTTAESQGQSERIQREYTPIGVHRALDRRVATLEKTRRKR